MRRRNVLVSLFLLLAFPGFPAPSWASPDELKPVAGVELQPLVSQVRRVKEALAYIGRPLSAKEVGALEAAIGKGGREAVAGTMNLSLRTPRSAGLNMARTAGSYNMARE